MRVSPSSGTIDALQVQQMIILALNDTKGQGGQSYKHEIERPIEFTVTPCRRRPPAT